MVGSGYVEEADNEFEESKGSVRRAERLKSCMAMAKKSELKRAVSEMIQSWFRTVIVIADQDDLGQQATTDYLHTHFPYYNQPKSTDKSAFNLVDDPGFRYVNPTARVDTQILNKHSFTTKAGLLGIRLRLIQEGDVLCVLFGACVPFILRTVQENRFVIVGEAYVDSTMDGEMMQKRSQYQERLF
ncbi:hypothetical protein K469DRAFT_186910 [Zopfia rhizophila CBS 207.26]|uniref:Uncharacterized protein n=1 Tax=Zopfia rhizophila CBS 207.26 TaxID=1314779 RepID=A0A6A6ET12_9PEZI|nr:hypothetical protein K469DRAFT_186910 [Zopfia rhizophila CBS 207.26]